MTGKWTDDPPRPSHLTPGRWNQICREKEAAEDSELAAEREKGKQDAKAMFKRVTARGGQRALNYAMDLIGTGMTLEQIEKATGLAVHPESTLLHRPGTIAAIPAVRAATPEGESNWLREAREHAEAQWSKATGRPVPLRKLSPEEIALNQSFNTIAAQAASLTHDPDSGQKIFRSNCPDQKDAELFRRGEQSARKLWPGW
jgi:hypothetical protein